MNDRIIELESRIALLEDALRELSDEYAAQQQALELLNRKCDYLRERLDDGSEGAAAPGDEPPPHY